MNLLYMKRASHEVNFISKLRRKYSRPRWRNFTVCGKTGNGRTGIMKIYYKKNFISGVVCLLLGANLFYEKRM